MNRDSSSISIWQSKIADLDQQDQPDQNLKFFMQILINSFMYIMINSTVTMYFIGMSDYHASNIYSNYRVVTV